jgi:hypothetical protein
LVVNCKELDPHVTAIPPDVAQLLSNTHPGEQQYAAPPPDATLHGDFSADAAHVSYACDVEAYESTMAAESKATAPVISVPPPRRDVEAGRVNVPGNRDAMSSPPTVFA